MATKINFTKAVIDALPIPETGRVYYFDKGTNGLCVSVMAGGTKTFFLYKRMRGKDDLVAKPVRYKLGKFPDMQPQVARQEAVKVSAKVAAGENPQEERRKARIESANAKSLQQVWEHYRDNHLMKHCAKNSARNHGYFIAAVPFTNKKLSDITPEEVKHLHRALSERARKRANKKTPAKELANAIPEEKPTENPVKEGAPTMANSTVAFLRTLYLYAADELSYTGRNPVTIRKVKRGDRRRMGGIVLNPKKSRKRFLRADELPAFFEALKNEPDEDFRDLILLLLFTGARRGNVQEMKWDDVSLDRATWTIPMTKNGDPLDIGLSPWAMEVLKQRLAKRSAESEFVFPSARAESGHIEEPKKQWWELLKRAKLEDLHMHDLRRTLATYQRSTGATLEIIGASLGHRSRQATEIYARTDAAPVLAAVTTATRALVDAGKYELAEGAETGESKKEQTDGN